LHSEGLQHLCRASKLNRSALLPDRQRRQEDWNQPILAPREAIGQMAGHLKLKVAISPLMKELARRGLLDRKTTQDEGPRCEPWALRRLLTLDPDARYRFGSPQFLFRPNEVVRKAGNNRLLQTAIHRDGSLPSACLQFVFAVQDSPRIHLTDRVDESSGEDFRVGGSGAQSKVPSRYCRAKAEGAETMVVSMFSIYRHGHKCSFFAIHDQIPKLDVAVSIPVSRSI
jgi:hypothetical protein